MTPVNMSLKLTSLLDTTAHLKFSTDIMKSGLLQNRTFVQKDQNTFFFFINNQSILKLFKKIQKNRKLSLLRTDGEYGLLQKRTLHRIINI